MYRVIAPAIALLTIGLAAVAQEANAEVAGPAMTQRAASKQLATDIKQARVETSGAKTFIVNGRRVLVPSNANAEAVIKALKARYPGLQADTRTARGVTALAEK
jgi:hypothetical protein